MSRAGIVILLALLITSLPAAARPVPDGEVRTALTADGLRIEWHGQIRLTPAGTPEVPGWPLVTIGGLRLPAYLMTARVADGTEPTPRIIASTSVPFVGAVEPAPVPLPRTLDGQPRPELAPARPPASLPGAPVSVLRAGWIGTERVVVLAVTPVYAESGEPRAASSIEALLPGAALLDTSATPPALATHPAASPPPAPDPRARGPAAKVRVTAAGLQVVRGTDLAATGLDLGDPSRLHVRRGGASLPRAIDGSGAGLELRFYAPPPGDRWNAADTYWITVEAAPGPQMASRGAPPGPEQPRSVAFAQGAWRNNRLYDPILPGPDGDHWFTADLRVEPLPLGIPSEPVTATLTAALPAAPGTTIITVTGSALTGGEHNLRVALGAAAETRTWRGPGDWSRGFSLAATGDTAFVTLAPGPDPDGVEIDSVAWTRPVSLDVQGAGALFAGSASPGAYQLDNVAPGSALYDISDPRAPALLTGVSRPVATRIIFGDTQGGRSYLLTGPGTVHTPSVTAHTPVDLAAPLDATAVYIAPAELHAALQPLVDLRGQQGHSARLIDVQAIYDSWSFGQVSPEAIRSFLRYAAATWATPPQTVTLVGDGTADPLNYTGNNNVNYIPPYLAMVDPFIRETACDSCYGRINTDDPLADPLPALSIGRLPVKSPAELQALVAKLSAYEHDQSGLTWRARVIYIADNTDKAGDFAALADASAASQPRAVEVRRVYYDPTASGVPWREPDPLRARANTLAAMNDGAAVVSYMGHGNQWQWAVTGPPLNGGQPDDQQFLLGLYDPDGMKNGARLPVVLAMTCLTSAFQTPSFAATTVDERLLLKADGGAAAVWGSTGLGVKFGHESLQRGFFTALWSTPAPGATAGALTQAGYRELFQNGDCCQESLWTFVLLGDPLTPVRARQDLQRIYTPITRR